MLLQTNFGFVISALIQLGVQVSNSKESIQDFRHRIAQYIIENDDFLSQLESFFFQSSSDFEVFPANLKSGREWFVDASILAYARPLERDCLVLTLSTNGHTPPTATTYLFVLGSGYNLARPRLLFTLVTDRSCDNGHFEFAHPRSALIWLCLM
jgi:hypothetical protein